MEIIFKNQESSLYFQDSIYDFENTELINSFVSFQDSFSEKNYEEEQIYYIYSTEEKSKDYHYSFDENIESIGNQINFINNIKKKIKKKKEEKKKKEFKSNLKIFVNLKQKNKKISDYLTATERKQRKMLKNLKKRKEKMKIKYKVQKRKNNSEILKFNNLFKTPILLNEKDFQKFPCSFIGRKRMKF